MESLGINPVLLVAQIVSFLILFTVFKKFLYGKIIEALEERRNNIQKTFTDKEELEKKLKNVEIELEEKRKETLLWKKSIETEANKEAQKIREDIVQKAEGEGNRELQKARGRIKLESIQAKKDLTSEVKDLTLGIINKVIESKTKDSKWQRAELEKSLNQLSDLKK